MQLFVSVDPSEPHWALGSKFLMFDIPYADPMFFKSGYSLLYISLWFSLPLRLQHKLICTMHTIWKSTYFGRIGVFFLHFMSGI